MTVYCLYCSLQILIKFVLLKNNVLISANRCVLATDVSVKKVTSSVRTNVLACHVSAVSPEKLKVI
jgi:hypothetical protein